MYGSSSPTVARIAILTLSGLILCACAVVIFGTMTGGHEGTRHGLSEASPSRMPETLVYDPGVLDTLDELQVDVQGVPSSAWSGAQAKYASGTYRRIGSLFEPDYEAVFDMHPDLILVADRSAAKMRSLATIGPTLDLTVDTKHLVAGVRHNALLLGRIYGREGKAAELVQRLDHSLEVLRNLTRNRGRGLVLLTSGGRMSVYGSGSRFGVIHDDFGIASADSTIAISVHGQAISYEYLAKTNPEWLFVIDRDTAIGQEGQAAARLLDNPLVRTTTAWKRGQIVYLDSWDWYMSGLIGIGSMQRSVDVLIDRFACAADGNSSWKAADGDNCAAGTTSRGRAQ